MSSAEDADELRVLLGRLLAGRWWIAGSVVLFTAVFAVIALVTAPAYRASVLIAPANSKRNVNTSLGSALGQLGGLATLTGLGAGSDSETEEALAVLQSREFTIEFIKEKQLLPVLFAKKYDSVAGKWKDASPPTLFRAFQEFDDKIRAVTRDRRSGLVTLEIDWTDPDVAAEWANEMVQRLNVEMRGRAIAASEASLGFLQKELTTTSAIEVREALNRLVEAQINQRMLANVTQEYSFRVVDKAIPPDRDRPIKPRRMLLLGVGLLAGLIVGAVLALFAAALPPMRLLKKGQR